MAVIERPLQGVVAPPPTKTYSGWASWLTTVDHKKIGIMYIVSAFVFFIIGGIEALLIRTQLVVPDNNFLTPDVYNQLMTMHGTTMVFLGMLNIGPLARARRVARSRRAPRAPGAGAAVCRGTVLVPEH